jgi:hypothetical protein
VALAVVALPQALPEAPSGRQPVTLLRRRILDRKRDGLENGLDIDVSNIFGHFPDHHSTEKMTTGESTVGYREDFFQQLFLKSKPYFLKI